jgi:hypothetical protein
LSRVLISKERIELSQGGAKVVISNGAIVLLGKLMFGMPGVGGQPDRIFGTADAAGMSFSHTDATLKIGQGKIVHDAEVHLGVSDSHGDTAVGGASRVFAT